MAARSYSPEELLRMREAPLTGWLSHHLQQLLRENTDLNDISQKPFEKPHDRRLTRISEDTRETSCDSVEYIPAKRGAARQLDGTESEMRGHGRVEYEVAQPQPRSAPSGLAAQKSEGFQRFYRAVVSPTHVRVTAGGRIVPNTRGPGSPTSKRSRDKTEVEGPFGHQLPQQGQPGQNAFPLPQGPFGPYPPPMYPGFFPGVNPAMAPAGHRYPYMPWHMGVNMGGNFAVPLSSGHQTAPTNPSFDKTRESSRSDRQSESAVSDKPIPPYGPVPDQFDPGRSAFYNGQWMFPPAGGQFYPFPMAPPHGFPGPPFGMPLMAPPGLPMNHATRPPTEKPDQSVAYDIPVSTPKTTTSYIPPSKPPVSSIRPSEITRRHLDILRARLKYLEDQLNYNKHQIDEKSVENDAQLVRQYIEQFEKNLEIQLSIEETQYPKPVQKNDLAGSKTKNGGGATRSATSSESRPHSGNHTCSPGHKVVRETSSSRLNPGSNSTKSTSAFAGWVASSSSEGTFDQGDSKSMLPVETAMAAPFQPRPEASSATTERSQADQHHDASSGNLGRNPALPQDKGDDIATGSVETTGVAGHKITGVPYLVGHLPYGVRPSHAKDTDYTYPRPLTEDELRARHMYWGRAPGHLQKGLPKFNGKDFYPPSPVKGCSCKETSSDDVGCEVPAANTTSDPFQALGKTGQILTRNGPGHSTQSEFLPRGQDSAENLTNTTTRSMLSGMRIGRSLDELNGNSQETEPASSDSVKEKSSSDEAEDDRELIFTGRRTMSRPSKFHREIWSNMLKRGSTSANVVPGAVSPTTVQGLLPQYAGHATASLTPAMARQAASPRGVVSKPGDQGDTKAPGTEKQGENRPPTEADVDEVY